MSLDRFQSRLLVLGLLPLLLPVSACSHHAGGEAGAPAIVIVPVARVVHTHLSTAVTLTAEFEPYYEVDVMAKEAGYIRHINVDIGDHVHRGQLLATLEIPELADDLTKAKADVKTAVAEKAVAQDGLRRAEAADAIARISYDRIERVSKKEPGLVPQQQVDVARAHTLEAGAQVSAAQQGVEAAESRYQSAKAELAHESTLMAYTRITAPFEGVVTARYASDGSMIQAGVSSQTQAMPVVKVSQNNILRLMLPVPEDNAASIHDGQRVTVTVPALQRSFDGRVTRFSGSLQVSTRTMTAEVDVKNPTLTIIPGMYAQVLLDLADVPNATAAPLEAIDGTGAAQRVFVVDSSGRIRIREVTTGIQSPNYVQILSGVAAGETVITGRHSDYYNGEKVQPHFMEPSLSSKS